MSLQPNGAIIRASSVNACDAAESCLPAGNVSAALPHEEFFLEQVAGEGMSADGIIPLFSRGVSVLLFSRGKAEVRINGKSYSADAGTVATVIADEIVELENVSEDCVCAMVSAPSETVIDFPSPADSDIPDNDDDFPRVYSPGQEDGAGDGILPADADSQCGQGQCVQMGDNEIHILFHDAGDL